MRTKIIGMVLLMTISMLWARPKSGDIFRQFTYVPLSGHFGELDPNCPRKADSTFGMRNFKHMTIKELNIDLAGAIRAEVSFEYWGGHIGTSDQKFRVNGNEWILLPQPHNTPTAPQCYYRTLLGNETVEIPLKYLKNGCNEFQFTCGPQICHNFNWGFYWIYSWTVYVYYDEKMPHPTGKITSPKSGTMIGERPVFEVQASSPNGPIQQVDYIGYYNDFDWDGNGVFEEWQYQTNYGVLKRHIGSSTCAPYRVTWETNWIPDQNKPVKVMARIMDRTGMCFLTPALENLTLTRENRKVKMYRAENVPENFGVRVGRKLSCSLPVPDDLSRAKSARIIVSTWSAAHSDEIGLNETMLEERLGKVHDYSYDSIPVPIDLLKTGENIFYIFSNTKHHALEVNWPGPILLVVFEN